MNKQCGIFCFKLKLIVPAITVRLTTMDKRGLLSPLKLNIPEIKCDYNFLTDD